MLGIAVRLPRHCEIFPDSDSFARDIRGWVAVVVGLFHIRQVDLLFQY